jgi:hypothetical protein
MSGVPKITFNISSQGLGRIGQPVEKVPALVLGGESFGFDGIVKQLFSINDAIVLGINPTATPVVYDQIKQFYNVAGKGSELFIIQSIGTMTDAFDDTVLEKIMIASENRVSVIAVNAKIPTGATITHLDGLHNEVAQLVVDAQLWANAQMDRYKHLNIIISGSAFNGTIADLKDYNTDNKNRVSILLSNTNATDKTAAIGMLLGRLASVPTQRKISRVKDGAITNAQAYMTNGIAVESFESAYDPLHNKGYIFLRSFLGKSGFFFSSDVTCTATTDDFSSIARGQVMGEAIQIAYTTLINEVGDEIPITTEGKVHPAIVKTWENNVERQINALMTDEGKISACKCYVDENQNILTQDEMIVELQILPVGYADYITVNIGFTTNIEE